MPLALLFLTACAPWMLRDPAPGLHRSRTDALNLACERVSVEAASRMYPGRIDVSGSRGDDDYLERTAVVCRERLTRPGLREPRDEAILSRLEATATDLATAARALRPDLEDRTWLVEAYYPSASVAAKIAFATQNALVRRGLRVSDRAPVLAPADVAVLGRLPPDEAHPAACRRYFDLGSLREGDVLLAVVSRDPRETILHAGLCEQGRWTWLR